MNAVYRTVPVVVIERDHLTREAIVSAAHDLVVADGLEGMSLRRVAAVLGVTAPALYAHIDDKNDLLEAVATREFERLIDRLEAIPATDPLERVRGFARAYIDHARSEPALFQVLFLFRPQWSPDSPMDEYSAATRAFGFAAATVDAAMQAGALRRDDPIKVSIALWAAAHGAATVTLAGLALGEEYEAAIVDTVIDNLVRGLAAPIDEPA